MARLTAHALMYHDVVGSEGAAAEAELHRYALSWPSFVEHLERMEAVVGVAPVVFEGATVPAGSHRWLLTFDDGGPGTSEVGKELHRRGWRASFFITTGLIGQAGFVDADAIRALHAAGHVVGSHTVTHPDRMGALPLDEILREWRESIETLSEILGEPVRVASVPGGYYRRQVAEAAARAGVGTLFTSEPVRTVRRVDGCLVVGRYVIQSSVGAPEAAAAAAGDRRTWLRQYAAWNVRKPAKALGSRSYERIRRVVLARRAR